MGLTRYKQKRDFKATPEPAGGALKKKRAPGLSFVVQKHDASRLHYDFRLELDGVLKSWAVPKGPSLDPADRRLAIEVEDHPVEYGAFEGAIPKGQYGGGTVMVWDRGAWTPEEPEAAAALRAGKLSFTLDGEKLKGGWTLTRMRGGRATDEGKNNWLLIKQADEHARPGAPAVTDELPLSVKTGRDLDEIAAGAKAATRKKTSERPARKAASKKRASAKKRTPAVLSAPARAMRSAGADPSKLSRARRAPMPREARPELCTPALAAPTGDQWIHELKFDGYRFLCRREKGGVALITRARKDWTHRFPPVARAILEHVPDDSIIDGELVVLDDRGRSSFQGLQRALRLGQHDGMAIFAFDVLHCRGWDVTRAPLRERKALLRALLPEDHPHLRHSDHVVGDGREVQENACRLSLEGIVSKNADSVYVQSRTRDWLKIKCVHRQEFVVVGWTPPSGSRERFGALLLGAHDEEGRLVYTGKVGAGFDAQALNDIGAKLARIRRSSPPTDTPPPRAETRAAHWVRPRLVAEIEFTEWTADRRLRHPTFIGLREDKEPQEVVIEHAEPPPSAPRTAKRAAAQKPSEDEAVVAGVRISNPDRALFPGVSVTKLGLAHYYEAVADELLPHIESRPLSVVRCPQGAIGKCFFQKHLAQTFGPPVGSIRVKEKEKEGAADYIAVDSVEGLVSLVQFGVIEIHPWGSREGDLERPDVLTFDLDPGPNVAFERVKEAAVRVRDVLGALDLVSFLKTSGGKGLHVVVPLAPGASWNEARAFCSAVAHAIAAEEPDRYVATMSKAKRAGKVFIDYLRNSRGATSVAPWSARARAGAPVSMPIKWTDLRTLESAAQFTVPDASALLNRRRKDPWDGYFTTRRRLTAARLKALA